jgi:hypothetical protein
MKPRRKGRDLRVREGSQMFNHFYDVQVVGKWSLAEGDGCGIRQMAILIRTRIADLIKAHDSIALH